MPPANRAIVGATIRTLDPERPFASAVAIRDGIIIAVGDDASIRAECDATTDLIDGRGLTFVPGLTDSGAEATQGIDLSDAWTLEELFSKIAEQIERNPKADWITGWGLHYQPFLRTGIRADVIDEVTGNRPAYLGFFDFHTALANRAALDLAGISGAVHFDEEATVVTDPDGTPTGELREAAAMHLVFSLLPRPTEAERYRIYVDAIRAMNAVGLTGVHAMGNIRGDRFEHELFAEMEERGDLTIRAILPVWQQPETSWDEMKSRISLCGIRGCRWRGGTAKFFIDGVIDTGTAWLVEPDTEGDGTKPFWPDPQRYRDAVTLFARAGFQCITHAVGDMAVRYALDSYEFAGAMPGVRHRVEHIEQLRDEDLPRFKQLDVVASMQPLHMDAFDVDGSDVWQRRIGPERMKYTFRSGDLRRSGATVALGSDWSVAPFDPRIGMAWARLRRRPGHPDRPPIEPNQALSALEALEGYTTHAACTVSEEHISGRIKAGFRADLTGFAEDPVDCDADDLVDLPVLLTMGDGEVVYRAA
jgi:predicted amidohydrolase YtcJ